MNDRDDSPETPEGPFQLPPTVTELSRVAQLAVANRRPREAASLLARNLAFLSPDAFDMDLADPDQRNLGDYELLEKIGQGGMGIVYRAHQRSLDREVAVKLLIAGPRAPKKFIERFQIEAQSAARLEHPNIVTVHEVGNQRDIYYFSMRLVRGETLSDVLRRRGGLPPREAAQILRDVAEAVDYAHRLGVLHLDLKPGNVLIDEAGQPLVADFGLARRLSDDMDAGPGEIAGTPSYMAPEQAGSKTYSIGVATDVYGLGCILYEMLCAHPPFIARTEHETLERVLQQEVESPRAHAPNLPLDLEAVCIKCLRKNPADRYESAADLADDLQAFLQDRAVSVRRPPLAERMQRWVRREPRLAAAVAAVAAALVLGLGTTSQQWLRAENNASAAQLLTWESRREAALQLEQDGRGEEARDRLRANLREQQAAGALDQATLERLRLGVLVNRGTRLVGSTVLPDARPMAARLSPDSRTLVVAASDLTLRRYDAETLEEAGRVSLEPAIAPKGRNGLWRTSDGQARLPQLLRFVDDTRLLVTLEWIGNRVSPTGADTWLVDLEHNAVIEPPEGFTVAAFSSNARWALLAGTGGEVELWRAVPDWGRVAAIADADPQALTWLLADDGRSAFSLAAGMRGLQRYDLTGGSPPQRIAVPGDEGISAWMPGPDGSSIALGSFDGNVFVLDAATLALRQLPTQRGREITWLEFGERGEWLAIGEYDGLVQVVDLAADDLLVGVGMRAGFTVRRVGVSRQQRLVIAAGEGRTALWRLPRENFRARPASRVGTAPDSDEQAWLYPSDWSLESGLFADAGMDGQIRLWHLPTTPSLPASSPSQTADGKIGDSDRLVDVDYDRIRLVSPEGQALTGWLQLPQPPGFADLLDDGRLLLVTVGATLHAYDAGTLTRRYAPVELPATPERLLATPDGRFVLLSFGAQGAYGHEETLRSFDAVDGRWLAGETVLDGPVRRYAFSPDEEWIVAQGPPLGVTTVLERDGLALVNEYVHDPRQPVASVDFLGKQLMLLTRTQPENTECASPSSLLIWDPVTNREERTELEGQQCLVRATGDGYAVFGYQYDLVVHENGDRVRLPRLVTAPVEGKPTAAMSPDGRVLARGFRHEVQLHDAVSGEPIGAPLFADISSVDFLAEIEFVDDGRALRGRSATGINLLWDTSELRSEGTPDPGPWPKAETRPSIPLAANSRPGVAIPARNDAAPPRLLDLGPVYNQSPWEVRNTFFNSVAGMEQTPLGVQRFGGIDFDVRGIVQLGSSDGGAETARRRIECLPVPATPVGAFHLLAENGLETSVPAGETLAELTLHYADGTRSSLPLRAGIELKSYGFDDSAVPSVFATYHLMWRAGGPFHEVLAPRLENPAPERLVRCLDLAWLPRSGSFAVFAITVDPP